MIGFRPVGRTGILRLYPWLIPPCVVSLAPSPFISVYKNRPQQRFTLSRASTLFQRPSVVAFVWYCLCAARSGSRFEEYAASLAVAQTAPAPSLTIYMRRSTLIVLLAGSVLDLPGVSERKIVNALRLSPMTG